MKKNSKAQDKAEAYEKFMNNPDNQGKCKDCPENKGYDTFYLCGQQTCWVTVHCKKETV